MFLAYVLIPFASPGFALLLSSASLLTTKYHQIYLPFQCLADNIIISTLHLFLNAEWLHYSQGSVGFSTKREINGKSRKNPFSMLGIYKLCSCCCCCYSQCLLLKFPHFDTINLIILVHNTPPSPPTYRIQYNICLFNFVSSIVYTFCTCSRHSFQPSQCLPYTAMFVHHYHVIRPMESSFSDKIPMERKEPCDF